MEQLEALLLQIAETAQEHSKQYYIGGGIAVDLAFGGWTRVHEDIDFYPMEDDTDWWKEWFRSKGYTVSKDTDMVNLPNAFSVLSEDKTYFADVYPIAYDKDGQISMLVKEGTQSVWDGMLTISGTRGIWEIKSWKGITYVNYKGQIIAIDDYRTVLMQKEQYIQLHPGEKLTEKHLYDFNRAGVKPTV